jgi:hypothetical protein
MLDFESNANILHSFPLKLLLPINLKLSPDSFSSFESSSRLLFTIKFKISKETSACTNDARLSLVESLISLNISNAIDSVSQDPARQGPF